MATLSIGQALDLGTSYAIKGDHTAAIEMFRGVLVHEPENFEAMERLGSSLFEMKDYYQALYWFWRGRKVSRRHPLALTNYGLCLSQLGHSDEGVADLERATALAEKMHGTLSRDTLGLIYNNLGNTLERLGRYQDALAALGKGIGYDPLDPFPHYNRGVCLLRLGRQREAIDALNRSLALQAPDGPSRLNDADAHYNRGMAHLLLGEFAQGFADYESRLTTTENITPNLGLPELKKWRRGEPIEGKTVLVHAEQGIGDTIQFLRFLPALVKAGAKVLLVLHAGVRPFAEKIPGVTVLDPGQPWPDYDCWVAQMSLPLYLGIEDESELPPPYLPIAYNARRCEGIAAAMPPGFRVGIVWAGNFQHKNDRHRSIALGTFAKLFDAPVEFISLQQMRQEDADAFAKLQAEHHNLTGLHVDTLPDVAATIAQCDLVISVDTAIAHLAASMNVPTWILVCAFSTDWRWQLDREDSPWYPAATLYRQSKVGDWDSVIKRVRNDLSAKAAQRAAA